VRQEIRREQVPAAEGSVLMELGLYPECMGSHGMLLREGGTRTELSVEKMTLGWLVDPVVGE
jgi:hypothetical protein